MAEAWVRAINSDTGVNAALLHMASDVGMTTKVIPASMGEISGSVFFNRYAGRPVAIVDKPLGGGNPHSAMMHLVQDLVVNRGLKGKGLTSGQFRSLLNKVPGTIKLPWQVAKDEPKIVRIGDYGMGEPSCAAIAFALELTGAAAARLVGQTVGVMPNATYEVSAWIETAATTRGAQLPRLMGQEQERQGWRFRS